MMKALRCLMLLVVCVASTVEAADWTQKRMKVEKNISDGIEEVLELTAEFHKTRVSQDSSKVSVQLATEIAQKLGTVANISQKTNSVQNLHITKIIQSAQNSIQLYKEDPMAKNASTDLKDFFKEIVQITQVFEVKKYKIFFCPQDRSLWLQTMPKAQNPVNLNLKNCGKPV